MRKSIAASMLAVAGLVLALVGAVLIPASPAAAATVDTTAWYVLVNRTSGKALDVYNLSTADGARITQWTRNDGAQ
ncbi:RICIN domain-containing protein, partial [Cellulomonas xylanilytica]|uniref:RICIN domain-containing protein n=1 Tax=Cellulomonas xylanilytica TaxID=233583 RepID=UPI0011BF123A